MLTRRTAFSLTFAACAGMMAFALYAEHVLELYPCPLCIFQRVAVIALGLVALLAAVHNPQRNGARAYGLVATLMGSAGVAIAARHVWLQNLPPDQVPACGAGLNYMLDTLPFTKVISQVLTASGECAEVSWRFLSLTMPTWVAIAMAALTLWVLIASFALPKQ
ncbi:MAG: disulfide bond formation protein B [Pseudomonadota bacterium]